MGYLPWWAAGLALTAISVGFWLLERRTLAVSGALERVLHWKADRALRLAELQLASLAQDPQALEAAMLEATRAQFGGEVAVQASPATQEASSLPLAVRPPGTAHLTFLVCLVVGGAIGAAVKGTLGARATLGADFEGFFGHGPLACAVLLAGGLCVGFGTRMAGGCTSGHGLVGCARLQPGSLLATGVFFGAGIGVAYLLRAVFA